MSITEQQINDIVSQASAAIDAIEAQAVATVKHLKSLQPEATVAIKNEPTMNQLEVAALNERIRQTNARIAKMQAEVSGWIAELPAAMAAVSTEAAVRSEAAVADKKTKKAGRQVKNLPLTIVGAPIYIESHGDRWNGTIVEEDGATKFRFNEVNYKSPTAACSAHAERITEKHPEVTKEASGWSWVFFAQGDFKDKPISEFYDSLPAAAVPATVAAVAAAGEVIVKTKKTLSPEHLAKLKAGRDAYLAAKKAEKEAAVLAEL